MLFISSFITTKYKVETATIQLAVLLLSMVNK